MTRLPFSVALLLLAFFLPAVLGVVVAVASSVGTPFGLNALAIVVVPVSFVPVVWGAAGGAIGLRLLVRRTSRRLAVEAAAVAVGAMVGGALGGLVLFQGYAGPASYLGWVALGAGPVLILAVLAVPLWRRARELAPAAGTS